MIETTQYANSVFEQPWWLDAVAPGEWHEIIYKDNGKVLARLPYVMKNGKLGNPRMTQTLGIWFDDSITKKQRGNSHLAKQKEIIFELVESLPKCGDVDIVLDSSVSYILPFRWKGFEIEPTFSYRLNNIKDLIEIDDCISKKAVQRHKKAAENLTVVIENTYTGINRIQKLVDLSYERQGRKNPVNSEFTKRIMRTSIENKAGCIMIAVDNDGIDHSGAFFVYDSNTFYYLLGGQNPNYKSDGAQNLVLRKGIEFAKTVSNSFDFEGSMIEGIENFFRQFGGTQVINYRVTKKTFFRQIIEICKPRIKRIIGYRM